MANIELISALAVLKANSEESKDYIDNFVPFVAEAIRRSGSEVISAPELISTLKSVFSFVIPSGVVYTILSRMEKNSLVERDNQKWIASKNLITNNKFKVRHDQIVRNQNKLFTEYKQFCKSNTIHVEDCENIEDCFYSFITSNMLDVIIGKSDEKSVKNIKCINAGKIYYSVGKFIQHITQNNQELFTILEDVVKGSMIANCLFYSKANEAARLFNKTIIYLDTKIILMLAGFARQDIRAPFEEMRRLISAVRAIPACFEHTIEEASNILYSAEQELKYGRQDNPSEVLSYFIDAEYTPSDIQMQRGRLRDKVIASGVRVEKKPPYTEQYGINEEKLEEYIEKYVVYKNINARKYDIDSIAATYRKCKGIFNKVIEYCTAIFVSTNYNLIQGSVEYFKDDFKQEPPINIGMTFSRLTTIAWAKVPQKAPELPKKIIISNCYAALKPSEEMWEKFVAETEKLHDDKLITDADYYFLRYSSASKDALSETAAGDIAKVTSHSVSEILRRAKAAEHSALKKELDTERQRITELETEESKRISKIRSLSDRVSKNITISVFILYTISVLWACYHFYPSDAEPTKKISDYLSTTISAIIYITSYAILIFNSDIKSLRSKLRTYISNLVFERIINIFK